MVRSFEPSGWPPAGWIDRTRRPRCSRVPSGPACATHWRTRSGRSRRSWIGSSSPNDTRTWPTSLMRSANTVRGSAPGCEPLAHASRTAMASLPSGTIRCRRSSARSGAISGLSTSIAGAQSNRRNYTIRDGLGRSSLRAGAIQSTSTAATPEGSRLRMTIPDPAADATFRFQQGNVLSRTTTISSWATLSTRSGPESASRGLDKLKAQLCRCQHQGTCLACRGFEVIRQQVQVVVAAASQPVLMQVAQEVAVKTS